MRFKKGDIVVAIVNSRYLTEGKEYEVLEVTDSYIHINDDEEYWHYTPNDFKLKENKMGFKNLQIKTYGCEGLRKEIVKELERIGYKENSSVRKSDSIIRAYAIGEFNNLNFAFWDEDIATKTVDLDDLKAMEPIISHKLELNSSYEAEFKNNGDIKVGCQTFTKEKIKLFIKGVEMNEQQFKGYFDKLKKYVNDNDFALVVVDTKPVFIVSPNTCISIMGKTIFVNTYELEAELPFYCPEVKNINGFVVFLTVLCHEIGHLLQFKDNAINLNENSIYEEVDANIRAEDFAEKMEIPIDKNVLWAPVNLYNSEAA